MNESQAKSWERYRDSYVVDVPRGELSTSIADGATVDWVAVFDKNTALPVAYGHVDGW